MKMKAIADLALLKRRLDHQPTAVTTIWLIKVIIVLKKRNPNSKGKIPMIMEAAIMVTTIYRRQAMNIILSTSKHWREALVLERVS